MDWELKILEGSVGDKTRFWEDKWLGRDKFMSLFPRLYSLSMDQGMVVGEASVLVDSG